MHTDSCHVRYLVSDVRINGNRIGLKNWCFREAIRNLEADSLSTISRTSTVSYATGDTMSFYREFMWYNPATQTRTATNFRSKDTLDWVVELIDASDGSRLALIDSVGVLR